MPSGHAKTIAGRKLFDTRAFSTIVIHSIYNFISVFRHQNNKMSERNVKNHTV